MARLPACACSEAYIEAKLAPWLDCRLGFLKTIPRDGSAVSRFRASRSAATAWTSARTVHGAGRPQCAQTHNADDASGRVNVRADGLAAEWPPRRTVRSALMTSPPVRCAKSGGSAARTPNTFLVRRSAHASVELGAPSVRGGRLRSATRFNLFILTSSLNGTQRRTVMSRRATRLRPRPSATGGGARSPIPTTAGVDGLADSDAAVGAAA